MNEHDDVICQVRDSFSGLRMDTPVEQVLARSRARRRHRLKGLTAATAATAGAATALTLTLGAPAPARSGNPPPRPSSHQPVKLAAFSVTNSPGGRTTVILHKGPRYPRVDPSALRAALARHGIPALVTVGTFCRSTPGAVTTASDVVDLLELTSGSALRINGHAIPAGTRLSIGLFPGAVRMLLIKDNAHLSCSSTSNQPAVHLLPHGTPIR